ncbi:MAG TPA: hypothetical protein VHO24_09865 [Opitutaceae bacterium]|nr:hypothetical protein [Opitutaceae bacterium]
MNDDHYKSLRAGINYILEGRQHSPHGTKIKTADLLTYGRYDQATIEESLVRWETAGYIRILKPFSESGPEDYCIEAKSFLEERSPIKGWLNWQ